MSLLWKFSYMSRLSGGVGDDDLRALVRQSWFRNLRDGISGALDLREGVFRQTVEGPPEAIAPLAAAILGDPRHGEIAVESFCATSRRHFSAWGVTGFDRLGPGVSRYRLPDGLMPLSQGGRVLTLRSPGSQAPRDGQRPRRVN